jgi:uncharacterized protein YrrD
MAPDTETVTDLVVSHGFFFPEDRVLPVDWVMQVQADGAVQMAADYDQLKESPTFDALNYRHDDTRTVGSLDSTDHARAIDPFVYYGAPGYSTNGVTFGPGMAVDHELTGMNADVLDGSADSYLSQNDLVSVRIGSEVVSSDDHNVGKVDEIIMNSADNTISGFVIAKGFFFTTRRHIPGSWVTSVGEDRVRLNVDRDYLNDLPDYDSEPSYSTRDDGSRDFR